MSREIINHRRCETLEDLQKAMEAFDTGEHPSTVYFKYPVYFIQQIETLTDGSQVTNLRIFVKDS